MPNGVSLSRIETSHDDDASALKIATMECDLLSHIDCILSPAIAQVSLCADWETRGERRMDKRSRLVTRLFEFHVGLAVGGPRAGKGWCCATEARQRYVSVCVASVAM